MSNRIFYNVFPKSGTHLIKQHRKIANNNHVQMYLRLGEYCTADEYIKAIKRVRGDFTGHVPYNDKVRAYLKRNDIRTIFIFRDLRDVAASLVWYVQHPQAWQEKPGHITEFNLKIDDVPLEERPDPLRDAIYIVAEWWEMFKEWLNEADTIFTYEELRPAAFLCGDENVPTFHRGNVGDWRREFQSHHIELANELLP